MGYHTREPTRQEIEFVEERLRAEVEFVEKVIEEAVEKRRVASITAEASDEGKTYFDGMKMVCPFPSWFFTPAYSKRSPLSQSRFTIPVLTRYNFSKR